MPRRHQSLSVLQKIIDECAKVGATDIIFVGGDPATHPNIVELGNYAHKYGMQTTILSNTLFFQDKKFEDVEEAFDNIETTIHSNDAKKHDDFCGCTGAYEKVIKNLLSFNSTKCNLGIVYNLTPETFKFLYDVVENLIEVQKIDLEHIVLQRIAEVGRATANDTWNLSKENVANIFNQVERLEKRYPSLNISFEDTFPYCIVPEKYKHYIKPCSWGYDSCPLDMDGNVSLCCTDPNYSLGNIFETPLVEIWDKSPQLLKKRSGLCIPEKCRICRDYEKCRGGCILSSITNSIKGDLLLS
jgi:radical SAM protein with 4Fe4S-binding SPASM domain